VQQILALVQCISIDIEMCFHISLTGTSGWPTNTERSSPLWSPIYGSWSLQRTHWKNTKLHGTNTKNW